MTTLNKLAEQVLSPFAYDKWFDLREEIKAMARHKRGVKAAKQFAWPAGAKVNIGSGYVKTPGFVTVDFCDGVDIQVDLRRPLPIPNAVASIILCEHFLEHLRYPGQAVGFLKECQRILQPGGELYISVPDTQWMLECYVKGDPKYAEVCEANKWHPDWVKTQMEHINYHFRQQDDDRRDSDFECHRYAYDETTLVKALLEAGFTKAHGRDFDPKYDAPHRREGSLFVKAVK